MVTQVANAETAAKAAAELAVDRSETQLCMPDVWQAVYQTGCLSQALDLQRHGPLTLRDIIDGTTALTRVLDDDVRLFLVLAGGRLPESVQYLFASACVVRALNQLPARELAIRPFWITAIRTAIAYARGEVPATLLPRARGAVQKLVKTFPLPPTDDVVLAARERCMSVATIHVVSKANRAAIAAACDAAQSVAWRPDGPSRAAYDTERTGQLEMLRLLVAGKPLPDAALTIVAPMHWVAVTEPGGERSTCELQ